MVESVETFVHILQVTELSPLRSNVRIQLSQTECPQFSNRGQRAPVGVVASRNAEQKI